MARAVRILAIVLLVCSLASCAGSGEDPGPAADPPPFPSSTPEASTAPATLVPVGAGPVGLAADDDGGAWVVLSADDRVVHLSTDSAEPDATVEAPGTPLRAVVADGAL